MAQIIMLDRQKAALGGGVGEGSTTGGTKCGTARTADHRQEQNKKELQKDELLRPENSWIKNEVS